VIVWAALVLPTEALAKVKLAGETATGAEPVPIRLTVCGLLAASSVNVNVPVRAPMAVGENVTPTLHDVPAEMLVPQVLLAIAKSPLGVMLTKLSLLFLWLVSVTELAVLVLPTTTVPKLKELDERLTGIVCAKADGTKARTQRQIRKAILRRAVLPRQAAQSDMGP